MGRLTLTNHLDSHRSILEQDRESGFADFNVETFGSIHVAAHRKRKWPVFNYYRTAQGDFAASAGTFLYKGLLGKQALEAVLESFDGDIERVRQHAMGVYLLAVTRAGKISVFVDKYEVLQAYYHHEDGRWVISNSLRAVASTVVKPMIHEFALLAPSLAGNDTLFTRVFRLLGSEHVVIDCDSGIFEVKRLRYRRLHWDNSKRDVDGAATEFAGMLRPRLETLAGVFGHDVAINATGGVDNRLILAGLLSVGVRPSLLHGVGDSILAPTHVDDVAVVKDYASKLGLPLHTMDWRGSTGDFTEYFDEAFDRYGFYGTIFAANRGMFQEYDGLPGNPGLVEFGYFGETLRSPGWVQQSRSRQFSIDDFLSGYCLPKARVKPLENIYPRYGDFYSWVREKFIANADYQGIAREGEVFDVNSFEQLSDFRRRASDVVKTNLLNQITCSALPLSCYELHEFSYDIPLDFRRNDRFVVAVIRELHPPLLDGLFATHGKLKLVDRQAWELVAPTPTPRIHRTLSMLPDIASSMKLPRGIRSVLRPVYARLLRQYSTAPNPSAGIGGIRSDATPFAERVAEFANEQQEKAGIRILDAGQYKADHYQFNVFLVDLAMKLYYADKIITKTRF